MHGKIARRSAHTLDRRPLSRAQFLFIGPKERLNIVRGMLHGKTRRTTRRAEACPRHTGRTRRADTTPRPSALPQGRARTGARRRPPPPPPRRAPRRRTRGTRCAMPCPRAAAPCPRRSPRARRSPAPRTQRQAPHIRSHCSLPTAKRGRSCARRAYRCRTGRIPRRAAAKRRAAPKVRAAPCGAAAQPSPIRFFPYLSPHCIPRHDSITN